MSARAITRSVDVGTTSAVGRSAASPVQLWKRAAGSTCSARRMMSDAGPEPARDEQPEVVRDDEHRDRSDGQEQRANVADEANLPGEIAP